MTLALVLAALAAAPASAPDGALGPEDCVRIALAGSGRVLEAEGRVDEWEARLAEVISVWYPKLTALGWVAPMYRVERQPGIGFGPGAVKNDLSEWGPYFHAQALLVQPVYTFGRASAGEKAASERVEVERARVQEMKNTIALETRKFYFLVLYARSLAPALDSAAKLLGEAREKAQAEYDAGTGKVTTVDLAKLDYGRAELEKYRTRASMGAETALAALKHTMGLPQGAELTLADERLPSPPEKPVPSLAELIRVASQERPEVAQLRHGKDAAISLEQAEALAGMPVVFVGGQIQADYTAMRTNSKNPYLFDPYNGVQGGVALGLSWDFDLAKIKAKEKGARALQKQLAGLEKFAATGIPMEVRKAHDDVKTAERLHELAQDGATAGRKWMTFAASAFNAGTGEPRDILEGLSAYLSAKRDVYDNLLAIHVGRAELLKAVGSAAARPDLVP